MRNGVYMTMVAIMWVFGWFEVIRYVWNGSDFVIDLLVGIMCCISSFLFVLEIDEEGVKKNDKRRK